MNLRDRREPLDHIDIVMRASLRARTTGKYPAPEVRQKLLRRAAEEERGSWRMPFSLPGIFDASARFRYRTPMGQMVTMEALFGPRLGWFSYNQIMR
jgi:hypothetical protein